MTESVSGNRRLSKNEAHPKQQNRANVWMSHFIASIAATGRNLLRTLSYRIYNVVGCKECSPAVDVKRSAHSSRDTISIVQEYRHDRFS